MFSIAKNGIITMNQGECCKFELSTNIGTEVFPEYPTISNGDQFYFSIMEPNQPFEEGLIRQVLPFNAYNDTRKSVEIKLTTRDTENLLPGTYYYGLKLRKNVNSAEEPEINTLISNTKLYII